MQRRLMAQCQWLATGAEQALAVVAEVNAWLLAQATPENYDDGHPANVLTQHRKRFGQLCAALTAAGYAQPQQMMLFDFHAAVDFLNAQRKAS